MLIKLLLFKLLLFWSIMQVTWSIIIHIKIEIAAPWQAVKK